MTFDYKKEYKEFYMPKGTPSIVRVPKMNYIAVRGSGNPNDADGEYKREYPCSDNGRTQAESQGRKMERRVCSLWL